EVDRRFHRHLAHQIAGTAATHRRHALATQAEQFAGLGSFRNLQLNATIQGWHFQLATQRRIGKADRHFAVQVLAVTLEDRVFANTHSHVQIAARTADAAGLAFAREANTVAGVDTRRHLDRQGLGFLDATLAVARAARVGNHLAATMATR